MRAYQRPPLVLGQPYQARARFVLLWRESGDGMTHAPLTSRGAAKTVDPPEPTRLGTLFRCLLVSPVLYMVQEPIDHLEVMTGNNLTAAPYLNSNRAASLLGIRCAARMLENTVA